MHQLEWTKETKYCLVSILIFHHINLELYLLSRLKKFEIMMILSPGQFYCISLSKERKSIKLDVILDKSTAVSAKNRKELLGFFQTTLEQIRKDIMAASAKPILYVDCPYCTNVHIKYTNLFERHTQLCNTEPIPSDHYQDLFKNVQGIVVCVLYSSVNL